MFSAAPPAMGERGMRMADEKKSRYTEAQNRATQKYIRENLEEIKFRVRKGEKDRYKDAAEKAGMSMAKFFLTAADEKIAREATGSPTRRVDATEVSLPSEADKCAPAASDGCTEGINAASADKLEGKE